jgi:hypothetical protein
MPTTKKINRKEKPMRAENTPAKTLMNTSAAPTIKGNERKSRDKTMS